MRGLRWGLSILLGLVFSLCGAVFLPADAQPDWEGTVIARFQEAEALAVDPRGRLYVADAGRDVVRILDRTGTRQGTIGGAGTRAGEFNAPADVDPTNGFEVFVADAGNGRIQRFSEEGQYLEALPVGRSFGEGQEQRAFDDGRDGSAVQGQGRPIAVASSNGDETFVIDEYNDVVLKWDRQRRPERVVGTVGRGGGTVQTPVALALSGDHRLYVADGEQQAVLAFDRFGSFVARLATPPLSEIRALSMARGRLWIVCAERVFVWNPDTRSVAEHVVDLPAPLVDAARRGDDLFLLTATRLYRRMPW